jgi:hypothetical protein
MSLYEKHLAEAIVDARSQEATGTGYIPIGEHIDALVAALRHEQEWRAIMHAQTDGAAT